MRQQLVHQAWIAVAAAVVFFTNLGAAALWDEDEPLYASGAREMIARGDWVVPVYNGKMFPEKPPLVYWTIIAGFTMFGVNEFAARFWSAVLAVGTALVTYHLGRRLFRPAVGLWAGLAVASCLLFTVSARAATVDSALVFVTTLALTLFAVGAAGKQEKPGGSPGGGGTAGATGLEFLPDSWIRFVLMYACLGVAVLAKGPVAVLVPCASIGLFLMVMNRRADLENSGQAGRPLGKLAWLVRLGQVWSPRNFLRSLWQIRPVTGASVVLAVALPWYVLVGVRTEGTWLAEFFAKSNWGALTGSLQGHGGPPWYYLPATMIGFFPWSVFLVPAVVELVRRLRKPHPANTPYVLAACWLGVYFTFWSLCGTKLPHYVLPTYPVLAVLVAAFLHGWIAQPGSADRRRLRTGLGVVIFAGIGVAVAIPIVASIYVPGEERLGLVGAILVVGAAVTLWLAERRRRQPAAVAFALTSVAFVTAIFGFAAIRVDRHQFAKPLVADVRRHSRGDPQFAGFRFIRESLVFYAGGPVRFCQSAEQLRQFLDKSDRPYVVTVDEQEPVVEKLFPGELTVVARRPRFLRSGEVVVFTRPPGCNVPRVAGTISGHGRR